MTPRKKAGMEMERVPDMMREMERMMEVRFRAKPEWEKKVLN